MDEERDMSMAEETVENQSAHSGKKAVNIVTVIILSVAVLVVSVVASFFLIDYFGVNTAEATPDEVTVPATDSATEATDSQGVDDNTVPTTPDGNVYVITQDWDVLADINSDIKAWIEIPNTAINYPVLKYSGDGYGSQYYLHRSYDKSYSFAGSIFIDYRSSAGINSKNIITHGHSMNNGSMYQNLLNYGKYIGNLDYYKQAPTVFFNTPEDGTQQWIIFSVYKTNTLESHGSFFNYFMGDFSSDAQFMNYVYNVKVRSLIDVPVPINEDDQLLTLSTCSQEYSDFRTVVVARKIRPGESVSSYVQGATLNKNPVWPEVYYRDKSYSRPEVTTFKTEYQSGSIDWYDGSGELEGTEWLTMVKGNSSFTVTFLDYDGSILSTQTVEYGHDAIPPEDPVKPDDEYYTYTFKGWQLDYTNVKCNMTIAPSFEPKLKE